jgi:hypothetical protein
LCHCKKWVQERTGEQNRGEIETDQKSGDGNGDGEHTKPKTKSKAQLKQTYESSIHRRGGGSDLAVAASGGEVGRLNLFGGQAVPIRPPRPPPPPAAVAAPPSSGAPRPSALAPAAFGQRREEKRKGEMT